VVSALLLMLPSVDTLLLLQETPLLGVDLGADLALLVLGYCVHDQLHTASLAGAIFFRTVLTEMAPFVVATVHLILLIEAHDGLICGLAGAAKLQFGERLYDDSRDRSKVESEVRL